MSDTNKDADIFITRELLLSLLLIEYKHKHGEKLEEENLEEKLEEKLENMYNYKILEILDNKNMYNNKILDIEKYDEKLILLSNLSIYLDKNNIKNDDLKKKTDEAFKTQNPEFVKQMIVSNQPYLKEMFAKTYAMKCIKLAKYPPIDSHMQHIDTGYVESVGIDMFINLFIKQIPKQLSTETNIDRFILNFNETMKEINDGAYSNNKVFSDRDYSKKDIPIDNILIDERPISQIRLLRKYYKKDFSTVFTDKDASIFFAIQILIQLIDDKDKLTNHEIYNMINFESNLKTELDKLYPSSIPTRLAGIKNWFGNLFSRGRRSRGGRSRGRINKKRKTKKKQV